jgi:FixJ family two-component response regulator
MSTNGRLSSRERAVVAALAAGLTKKEAAATIGIRPETVSRYLRDPYVCAALKEAQDQSLAVNVNRKVSRLIAEK